jgi:hypothetical protein
MFQIVVTQCSRYFFASLTLKKDNLPPLIVHDNGIKPFILRSIANRILSLDVIQAVYGLQKPNQKRRAVRSILSLKWDRKCLESFKISRIRFNLLGHSFTLPP